MSYQMTDEEIDRYFADLDGPPDPMDEVDLDDCDINDLVNMFDAMRYDGDAESGPQPPEFWVEPVERHDCDQCGAKDQRVTARMTVFPEDPTAAYKLACGHTII